MELSPGAKSVYEMLMAETTEEYESMFMAHKKEILDAVRVSVTDAEKQYKDYLVGHSASPPSTASPPAPSSPNSSASASSAPPCVPCSDVSVGGFSERAAAASPSTPVAAAPQASTTTDVSTNLWARAELDIVHDAAEDLAAPTPSTCSTVCVAGDTSSTTTPTTSTTVSSLPGDLTALSVVPVAVDIKGTELAALVPINCSSECPSHDDVVSVSVLSSPALDLLEGGASTSSLTPATYLLEDVDISMFSENMLPPWHSPWSTCIQNIHQLGGHDMPPLLPLLVESVECIRGRIEIRFCRFSSQVAEMFLFCCAACSIPNLHYMMDPKQISRDWLFSTTMELQWNATLAAINFTLGIQSVQLQPILFNWSVTFSDMMLAVVSIVAGLLDTSLITRVTTQNGSGAYLKPVLCLIINLFSWSPQYKWPPMSLNGPFLISVDVQQEFMGMYSVTAVLSWLCIFVVMRKEVMLWSVFQSARCSTVLLLPWDPGVLMDGMCANFHGFVIERTQPRLCAMKSPWPPPSSSRSTSYRTLNLHRTLDNMQLWVDCQVLKTWELQWSSVLIVIASAPRVKAQLKPTVFKWSNPFCLDKQFLSECTLDFLLARRTASIVWNYCCLDNLQCYLGSTNWALQEEQQPVLLQMPWQSFGYHWKAAYPMKPCSAIEGMFVKISTDQPRQDLHGSDEKSILHFTSFYDNNQLHVLVALGTFRCEFFSLGNTWDCLHYEYLQQWRPPDQTTEFLSVQHQWGCHAETACLRFTGRYLHGASQHLVSTLLLEFRCQSSQEYCDSARAVTRGQIVHSIAHNYSEEFVVVIYTTHNGMELIIGWESRSIGCSSWTEDFLPTRILELYNILSKLKVSQYFCSQVCEWQIPWWDVTSTVESVTTIKHISGMFSHALQYVEDGKYFAVVNLLMSSRLSHAWVLYRPVACSIHLGSKMIQWEIASSDDGIFTYTKRVLISWDPGGLNNVLAPAWNITQLEFWRSPWDPGGYSLGMHLHFSPGRYFVICYLEIEITSKAVNSILLLQLPWDPGGLIDISLRTSRILWGRDCQRPTSLHSLLGWLGGPLPWALACSGMVKEGNMKHIYPGELREEIGLDGTDWWRLRPRLGWRVRGVCVFFLLLELHLSSPMFL